jgi:hypothetical protein
MSSYQSQLPAANNAPETIPGTWEAIMERRRITKPSRLMHPYIPVESIPRKIRPWYPVDGEGVPPGFVEGHGSPFFDLPLFKETVGKRMATADKLRIDTGLPYRFNLENGKIELPAGVQVADSRRPLKRKRDLISSPASPATWQQLTPRPWAPDNTNCMFPSKENMEYMEYMSLQQGGLSMQTPSFGVRLPSSSSDQLAAQIERRSRALCSPPGPGSSRGRTPHVSRARSDSMGGAQDPQPRPPKPPVPLYPWK